MFNNVKLGMRRSAGRITDMPQLGGDDLQADGFRSGSGGAFRAPGWLAAGFPTDPSREDKHSTCAASDRIPVVLRLPCCSTPYGGGERKGIYQAAGLPRGLSVSQSRISVCG